MPSHSIQLLERNGPGTVDAPARNVSTPSVGQRPPPIEIVMGCAYLDPPRLSLTTSIKLRPDVGGILRTADRLTLPKWHRLMSFAVVGVLAATLLAFVPAMPASAAGCYAASCEGKDPSALGCAADAYTVAVVYDDRLGYIEGLELRYSPTCRANWARLSA